MTARDRSAAVRARAEAGLLRAAAALPRSVQRRLAGRPVVVDGQTLSVETQLMLRLTALAGPAAETLPVERGRVVVDRQSAAAGRVPTVGSVRELDVAGLGARLYVPTSRLGRPDPAPLLLFFHGGGFIYGGLGSHDASCRVLAEGSGALVLAVDYRLAPEATFPAAHDDALAAFRWVAEHADRVGADPARIAVGGDSAGGNLAASVAIAAAREGVPLAFQLLVYPITDPLAATPSRALFGSGFFLTQQFIDVATDGYTPRVEDRADPRMRVLDAEVPAGLAPAYVVTAGFDPLRDEGEAYARRLAEAGVPVELRRFPDLIHSFFNVVGVGRRSRAAVAEIAAALRAGLGVDRLG